MFPVSAPQGEDSDSSAPELGPAVAEPPDGVAHGVPCRRRRAIPRVGSFASFIVADAALPPPARADVEAVLPDASAVRCVVGLARCEWRLVEASDVSVQAHADVCPRPLEAGRRRAQRPWLFVQYYVVEMWRCGASVPPSRRL